MGYVTRLTATNAYANMSLPRAAVASTVHVDASAYSVVNKIKLVNLSKGNCG